MASLRQAPPVVGFPGPRVGRGGVALLPALPLAIAAAGALAGLAATIHPLAAVAAVVALALVPLVLAQPIVGVVALVFASFLEEYAGMTGALTVTKLLGALLVGAWLAALTIGHEGDRGRALLHREPYLAAALLAFTAWAAMSIVWAQAPAAAQESIQRYALNFLLFPVALVAIRTRRHFLWVIAAFAAGSFAAVVLGLQNGTIGEEGGRLKGAGINPNQLGSYLVVTIVFLATFGAARLSSGLTRLAAFVGAGVACLALFLTLSRGALVGMAAALLVAPIVAGRRRRLAVFALGMTAVLSAVVWYGAFAPADDVARVTNPEEGGGSGRVDLWRVGWRMVEDRPIQGVGAGNYPEASVQYLLRPGATDNDVFIVDEKKVAHNVYLTVVSELGVVGLAMFLFIVGICLRSALRAARAFAARGDPAMELVARALFLSLVALLVVAFFSSAVYVKQFWVLLAAAPALHALAERAPGVTGLRAEARPARVRAVG